MTDNTENTEYLRKSRRADVSRMEPAELAIRNAILEVEKLPAHDTLTDSIILLDQAKKKVSDYIDSQKQPSTSL